MAERQVRAVSSRFIEGTCFIFSKKQVLFPVSISHVLFHSGAPSPEIERDLISTYPSLKR